MFCCSNCFSDSFLESRINAISKNIGNCSFCGNKDVNIIDPIQLADYFLPLFDIYNDNNSGVRLNKILQQDWKVFGPITERKQNSLINKILPGMDLTKRKFIGRINKNEEIVDQWARFTQELKYVNRFSPKEAPRKGLFLEFGPFLGKRYDKGTKQFYRARINSEEKDFTVKQMRKPPCEKVTNGRANPIGISYLYVASDQKTAISEMRGHKGEIVSVIDFTLYRNIELFDLRDPQETISPFEQLDELEFLYSHMPFLILLGDELAKPVIPSRANLDYLSSQYLCEIIKQIGFHGIIYKSSIAEGHNYVIFDDRRLKAGSIKKFRISRMSYDSELIDD